MDIAKPPRKKRFVMSRKFFLEQQRLFLIEYRRARLRKKIEVVVFPKNDDPFTLSFM